MSEQDAGVSRIGIIVPRHSHSAVARNRVKRRIREIVRVERIGLGAPRTLFTVLYALPAAYQATFEAMRAELLVLRARASL